MHMPGSCSVAASHVGSAILRRPVWMPGVAGICARGAVTLERRRPVAQRPAHVEQLREQSIRLLLQERAHNLMQSKALCTYAEQCTPTATA